MAPHLRRCCVPFCNITEADNIPLHCFPNPGNVGKPEELERFRIWVLRIGGDIVGEDNMHIHRNRFVCHRHFDDIFMYPTNRLNRLAIPTLHLPGVQNLSRGQLPVIGSFKDGAIPSSSRTSIPVTHAGSACELQNLSQEEVPVIGGPNDGAIASTSGPSVATPAAHTGSACELPNLSQEEVPVIGGPNDGAIASTSGPSVATPAAHTGSACGLQNLSQEEVPVIGGPNDGAIASTSGTSVATPAAHTGSACGPKRRLLSKPMSKTERELRDTLRFTKNTLRRCKTSKNNLKIKLALTNKIIKTSAFEILSKKMTPAARTFFKMQISQFEKRPRGRRFSVDEKILALSLYKPCPKAYKLLAKVCILPKRRTLDKILQKVTLFPGINDALFEHLKKRVDKMPSHHKLCSVIFDEMAIAAHVNFDKSKDIINGFVDNGFARENTFCDHVLVFMVRGIIKKFKQPVAFTFCAGTTKTAELKNLIKLVIEKVTATGLRVVSTVCDQGATNMAAVNGLMNDTKANYLRADKLYKGGYFEIQNQKIYPIYDPPHIMKGIRNNMMTKDLEYVMEGKTKRAKWAHLEALYNRSPGYKGVRLISKLTAQHIIPSQIPKMRVKFCTQVFSQNVGTAMGYMAGTGHLPQESVDTADILLFFDNLFDSVNGSFSKPVGEKIYRSAVTPRSPHHKLWYKSLPILKSMKYVSANGNKTVVPSITSWVKTIEAFLEVTKFLHSLGLNSLLLRHFNQDPLENFFGAIRAHGLRNVMPSACAFMTSYKALLIGNLTSPHSVGSNCEEDEDTCLQSLKFFLTENISGPVVEEETVFDHSYFDRDIDITPIDTQNLITDNSVIAKEKCAAIAYCSGWLIQCLKKKVYKNCQHCKKDLESDGIQEFHSFIQIKEYRKDKTWLCYPTRAVFDFFCQVENITIEILKNSSHLKRIAEFIETFSRAHINSNFVKCPDHKELISRLILKRSIVFFLNNWCKEINQILSGNTTFWDNDDCMKQKANQYFSKHKKRVK